MLLKIENLKTYFFNNGKIGKAVDNISLTLKKNKIVALVGESGCGKSVTARSVLQLVGYPGKIVSGKIIYKNKDILKLNPKEMCKIRGKEISMIFQDPMNSLNPVFTIGTQLVETILTHLAISKKNAKKLALEMLLKVKLTEPEKIFNLYPHQLSGGMKQRVIIAIALSCSPSVLIADEPTTALDVSIRKEIIKLLLQLKRENNLSVLFITHDFRVVKEIADEVAVMYAGKIVEKRLKKNIFDNPLHPYTIGLLKSLPPVGKKIDKLPVIKGIVPEIYNYGKGCRFAERCEFASDKCFKSEPHPVILGENEYVSCVQYF
jgi:oligopeptide/dipeptide ABC transporter ATP-binding protein